MKTIGTWWNDSSINLVDVNGAVFALNGWNGEEYMSCWKCQGENNMDASSEEYTLRPVYRFEVENIDLDDLEEGSAEWDFATEVVDYNVF